MRLGKRPGQALLALPPAATATPTPVLPLLYHRQQPKLGAAPRSLAG